MTLIEKLLIGFMCLVLAPMAILALIGAWTLLFDVLGNLFRALAT